VIAKESGRARRALRCVLVVLLALGAPACVLLPTLGGPIPSTGVAAVASEGGLVDVRGIVHCHSWRSHDSNGQDLDIARAAREIGARFVVLTDHTRHWKGGASVGPDGFVEGVLFMPGFESGVDAGGSIMSVGARVDAQGTEEEVEARIRAQGGLAAIGHPEERVGPPDGFDAVELMNLHANISDENKAWLVLRILFLPPGAFFRSLIDPQPLAGAVYDAASHDRPVAAYGACDAHEAVRPFGRHASAVDSYARVMRLATTHVLLRGGAVTKVAVLDALAAARSYAACELDADATGFRFTLAGPGGTVTSLGGTAPFASDLALEVATPAPCAISLLCDGQEVASVEEATSLRAPAIRPGLYRVLATLDGHPWIASSGIRVRSP
jgi:hypothetical protein